MPASSTPPLVRVLFIGNSYTARNDLPRLLAGLAASAALPLTLETRAIVAGGASLKRHWNAGKAREALRAAHWDHVVLQDQSTLPFKNPARYHEAVRLFDAEIERNAARTALYLTWPRRDVAAMHERTTAAVAAIARELDARVVPVGPAWEAWRTAYPEVSLYTADGSHPTAAGSYLAACVFLRALLEREPRGHGVADALGLEHALADRLHATAGSRESG